MAIQLRLRYSQSLKLCELQKVIPNHQSSFCWIYLLLLTLLTIRSSCPCSHHWTSLGFHFAGLNPISLVGLSGTTAMLFWLDVYQTQSNLYKWFRMQRHDWSSTSPNFLQRAFIFLHWLPVAARIKFKTLMLAYRTTTGSAPAYFHSLLRIYIPSRSPAYFHSLLRIYIPSRSPAYFHSLLRIYIPSRSPAYFHSLYESISLQKPRLLTTNLLPLQKPRLLPLTITNLYPLQNPRLLPLTITNLHPLQKPRLLQLTVKNLHPLQKPRLLPLTITNLHPLQKPRLLPLTITNLHPLQKPRLLPLTITNLHLLQKPRLLQLTVKNLHPLQKPAYFHSLLRIYIPSRSLRSASERRLVVPSQRDTKSPSSTFSFTVPGCWNDLPPPPHPERWIPVNLQETMEYSSLSTLLDFIINLKQIKRNISLYPSLASLNLFEQCLRLGVTSTFSVCLPLHIYLYLFL